MLCATRTRGTVSCVYVCIVGLDRTVPSRLLCVLIIGMRTDRQEPVTDGSVSEFGDLRDRGPELRLGTGKWTKWSEVHLCGSGLQE